MSRLNTRLLKSVLHAMHATRADSLVAPLTQGVGVIFMLHNVGPETGEAFEPNRILRITPEFLDDLVVTVKDAGFDFVPMDEVPARMAAGDAGRPFACLTFDDGYRDNRDCALPVLKKHNVPFTVYVASDFADGVGDLWWLSLEEVVRRVSRLFVPMGEGRVFRIDTVEGKYAAFHEIYWWLRQLPEDEARGIVGKLAVSHGVDLPNYAADLVMGWDELREFANEPLVTIGAHTKGHYALAKLPTDRARREMAESIERIESELDRPCRHFSFPYGSETAASERDFEMARELGVATAVTTRKGLIKACHSDAMTALPRLSLNGDYQDKRLVRTLLTGAPFALLEAAKRLRFPLPMPRPRLFEAKTSAATEEGLDCAAGAR